MQIRRLGCTDTSTTKRAPLLLTLKRRLIALMAAENFDPYGDPRQTLVPQSDRLTSYS